jgi:hypothetical protein
MMAESGAPKKKTRSAVKIVEPPSVNESPDDSEVEQVEQDSTTGPVTEPITEPITEPVTVTEDAPHASQRPTLDDLDDLEESDVEDSDGLSDMDDDVEWPCSTVMCMSDAVDAKLIAYFKKYLDKPGNSGRIFQPSMMAVPNENEDEEDEDLSNGEQVVDTEYRKCSVAKDTNTLNKLFNMLDDAVDSAVDKFVEKYQFFSIVSTKEDYTLLKFEEEDFYAEHIECTGSNDDSDGASRRLCVYVVLEAPEEGGDFEFLYQGCNISASPGSIIVFPACPLHPMKISGVEQGRLMFVTNYIL